MEIKKLKIDLLQIIISRWLKYDNIPSKYQSK